MWSKYLSKLCSSQEKDTTLRSYKLLMLGTSRQILHRTRCFTSVPVYMVIKETYLFYDTLLKILNSMPLYPLLQM